MALNLLLDALAMEPARALMRALRQGPLNYEAVRAVAAGGTADEALKRLVLVGAVRATRTERHSSYELTDFGKDVLDAIDLADLLPGEDRIFAILRGTGGVLVLLHHLGYMVRDLHEVADSTRNTVTRRLKDAGVLTSSRPPRIVDGEGHRTLLIYLHRLMWRRLAVLAAQVRIDARMLELGPMRPEDLKRVHRARTFSQDDYDDSMGSGYS